MNLIKKIIIYTPIILIATITIVVAFNFKYFSNIFSDSEGPEFAEAHGLCVSGPTVANSDDIYTITWSTKNKYAENRVMLQDRQSYYSGIAADEKFDATTNSYSHTAVIELSNRHETDKQFEIGKTPSVFSPSRYRYQVESYNYYDTKNQVISAVQLLN
ncbi:MAG: hypothetical protein WCW27_00650 [Patescibacteria group bacterium]